MWSQLSMLPPDVMGAHVFSRLLWSDVVHLDSAVVERNSRSCLHVMFGLIVHLELPKSHYITMNASVWNWFWKRGIRLNGILACNDLLTQWRSIQANAHLIRGGVGLILRECPTPDELCHLFKSDDSLCHIVSGFHAPNTLRKDPLVTHISDRLQNLKHLTFAGTTSPRSDECIQRLLVANPSVTHLRLESELKISSYLNMLVTLRNVRSLHMHSYSIKSAGVFVALMQAFPLLEIFSVDRTYMTQAIAEEGLTALAHSCPKLQSVTVLKGESVPIAMFQLALHCHDLRELNFSGHTSIHDSILTALSENCPHLEVLHCAWTSEVTLGGVDRAAKFLGQLRNLVVEDSWRFNSTSFARALQYTTHLQVLEMKVQNAMFTNAEVGIMSSTGSGDLRRFVLCGRTEPPLMDTAVVVLVQRNPRLTHLGLGAYIRDGSAILLALAQHCPQLEEVTITHSQVDIADEIVISLVQNCPKLRILDGVLGATVTDAAILAVAQYCPRLEGRINLTSNSLVTVSAVAQLMQQCRCVMGCVFVPRSFSDADVNHVRTCANSVQRSPRSRCCLRIMK